MKKAASRFKSCLKINPRYAGAYLNLAVVLTRQGRLEEAREKAQKARDLAGKNTALRASACYNLGYILDELRRYPEAVAAFEEAQRLSKSERAWLGKAVALAHQGKLAEAVAELQQLRGHLTELAATQNNEEERAQTQLLLRLTEYNLQVQAQQGEPAT